MLKLSINIPTYNRDTFLAKNLDIIASQMREDDLVDKVEINVSNNASTDKTVEVLSSFKKNNSDIQFSFVTNEKNIGPDLNFIQAMKMAKGEYSILFGDDDFFEPHAIKAVLTLIESNPDVTIFLSNRIVINEKDEFVKKQKFMSELQNSEIFDFSNYKDARAYFSSVSDLGGLLTFISSVMYKSSIIEEVGKYNDECTGSCYSFLYYWWSALAGGKKIMYSDAYYVRATTIGVTNNNYGDGLKRLLVDTEGLSTIANNTFVKEAYIFKPLFFSSLRNSIPLARISSSFFSASESDRQRLVSSLKACEYSESDIKRIEYLMTDRVAIKVLLRKYMPSFISRKINI